MANITKNQIKRRLAKLIEQLENIKGDLEDLQCEIEEESESIEPYENKWELTQQQEERQEWLNETSETISNQVDNLDDIISELDYIDQERGRKMARFLVGAYINIKGIDYTYKQDQIEKHFDNYFDAKKYAIELTNQVQEKGTSIRVEELVGDCWVLCFEIKN